MMIPFRPSRRRTAAPLAGAACAFAAVALASLPAAAQTAARGGGGGEERATGTVTVEQPPPEARGFTVEQDGRPVTGVVPPGGAVDIRGANVVVVDETPRGTRLTVQNDVLFDFDKSTLRPEATEALDRVREIIAQRHPRAVRIIGHTDSIGTEAYNDQLSLRRARSVEQWLDAAPGGMPPLQVEGKGEREPVAPNTTPDGRDNPEGRQKNRRVEILLER